MSADVEVKSPLGPLIAGRSCGECVACCQTPKIDTPELQKPYGALCQHNTGGGCAIYDDRPAGCRAFYCAWRHIEVMPERTRPDRLGVIFVLRGDPEPKTVFDNLYVAAWPTETPEIMGQPDVQRCIAMFARDIFPVYMNWQGQATLIHPDRNLAWAITDPAAVRDPALKARADKWLRDYAPYARIQAGDQVVLPPGY